MGRIWIAFLGLMLWAGLSACTTTEAPEGTQRVETWSSNSTWVDGKKVTTNSHKVGFEKLPEQTKPFDFGGPWHIQDYDDEKSGNRHCYVDLKSAKLGTYNYAFRTIAECHLEMAHIAAWRPTGSTVGDVIILVDKSGTNIGEFDKVNKSLYRGVITLTNGAVVKAHLKRW
ncbi:AprI/Inh family metalloprotease inhibitor [Maritalea sp.]|uniref:AprI/Inh family metalloprotease inhibitor n=1 Tax=Maritalea sp. TaxID=2003361 RepID=UPI003EF1CF41